MATVSTSLQLLDRFSNNANRAEQSLNRMTGSAHRLQNALNTNLQLRIDTSSVQTQIQRAKTMITSTIGVIQVDIQLRSSSFTSSQVERIRRMISTQVGTVQTDIQLRLSNNSTSHIQRFRDRLSAQISTLHADIDLRISRASLNGLRTRIQTEIGSIRAEIQVQFSSTVTTAVENLRRLVLLLLRSVRQLNSNFPISGARQLQDALQRIAQLEARINQLQRQLNERIREGGRDANGMLSTLKGIAAAYLSIAAAQKLVSSTLGAAMEQQQYLDTFVARAGNEALGNAIYDQVSKQALQFGQKVDQAMRASNSFMSLSMDPKQLTDLNKLAMRLSKLNPLEGLEGAAFSMKELMAGDYVSIVERFNIGRSVIKDSDALKAAKAGDVSGFIAGMDKLLNQQNMTEKAFEKMLDSPAAKWEKLIGNTRWRLAEAGKGALAAFAPLIDRVNAFFDSDGSATFFSKLQTGLYATTQAVGLLFDGVRFLYNFILSSWSTIQPILIAIASVYLVQIISMLSVMTAQLVRSAIAWMALNWPIVVIILAVWALIEVLNYFGVSTEQALGMVAGTFMALFATIWNNVALFYNVFAAVAEFLINIFIDPVYAIKKLFYDLMMTFLQYTYDMLRGAEGFAGGFMTTVLEAVNKVLGGINRLVDAMNNIPGFNIPKVELYDVNNVNAVSDRVKSMMNMLEKPTSTKGVVSTPRMQSKDIKQSFDVGYSAGAGLLSKFKMPELPGIDPNASYNVPKIDKIGSVDEVGKIKDSVDVSSEDLKVMRELAEMQSIQNFVTLTPTVNVQTGDIRNGYDIDTIIRRIEQSLEEQIATSAAGVYNGA